MTGKNSRFLAAALALLALASPQASAQTGFGGDPDLNLVESGFGWRLVEVLRNQADGDPDAPNPQFVAFAARDTDALEAEGLLPPGEAREIRDDLAQEGVDYTTSDDVFVVHLDAARDKEGSASAAESDCWGWQDPTSREKSWNWSHDGDFEVFDIDTTHFDGSLEAHLPVSLDARVIVRYKVKNAFCAPYKFRLIEARFEGSAEIRQGHVDAMADLAYTHEWDWERRLLKQKLGTVDVQLGPVPVILNFYLPLDFGIETHVEVAGHAEVRGEIDARAEFEVTCTSDDCDGDSTLTRELDISQPELSTSIDANVKIWARAGLSMEIYDDIFGHASISAEGHVEGHLFGYLGNRCGDADEDGSNDWVEALLLDVDAGYQVDADLGGALLPDESWTLLDGAYHLKLWDLLGDGGSSVLSPMIQGPAHAEVGGGSVTYSFKTRSCYPFSDALTLQWSGPVSGEGDVVPTSGSVSDSEAPVGGNYLLKAWPVRDAHGRVFNRGTSRDYATRRSVTISYPAYDQPQRYDYFGRSVAGGDFNCDGHEDLAIGAPREDVDIRDDAGMFTIVLADEETGLRDMAASRILHYTSGPAQFEIQGWRLGESMAAGDFDGDGCDDLAVGAPFYQDGEGLVRVYFGETNLDPQLADASFLILDDLRVEGRRDSGEPGYRFGKHLAAGDFDGDGDDDLAITIPGYRHDGYGYENGRGAVLVSYAPRSTAAEDYQLLRQGLTGTNEIWELGDGPDMSVAAGDFDGDGFHDLAVGYPSEDRVHGNDGWVMALAGSPEGLLRSSGGVVATTFGQGALVDGGSPNEPGDSFGWAMAAGDVDGDGYDDLAVTSRNEDWGSIADAGLVQLISGGPDGPVITGGVRFMGEKRWTGSLQAGSFFGQSVELADFDGDGLADLAVGASGYNLFYDAPSNIGAAANSGMVFVAYSEPEGTFRTRSSGGSLDGYRFSRQTSGFAGFDGSYVYTGGALAAGDFDGDGVADLAISSHGSTVGGQIGAGSCNVLFGASTGLSTSGSVHLHQND